MGGDLRVSSEVGVGTTFGFEVRLPISGEAEAIEERRTAIGIVPPDDREAAYRILVVDDAAENRTLLVKLLAPVGFDVREATNGRDAVEVWRSWQPELIFMDQRMPFMAGSEATRHIRAEETEQRRARTVIIALTASAFEHEREAILACGADDFVMKPYDENDIFDVIAKTLGVAFVERRPLRPPVPASILLVDDDMINRHIALELLSQLDVNVKEARNGAEALRLLDQTAFDAVLLDVEMPQLDGRETIKAIRAQERYRHLPVIAMTAHDRDLVIEGMTDYLAKPIDGASLTAVVGKYLPGLNPAREKKIV
jgi:CheY-like chemotaxis protein